LPDKGDVDLLTEQLVEIAMEVLVKRVEELKPAR